MSWLKKATNCAYRVGDVPEGFGTALVEDSSTCFADFFVDESGGHIIPFEARLHKGVSLFPDDDFVTFDLPTVQNLALFPTIRNSLLPLLRIGTVAIDPLNIHGMSVLNYVWWSFFFLTPVFGAYSCTR